MEVEGTNRTLVVFQRIGSRQSHAYLPKDSNALFVAKDGDLATKRAKKKTIKPLYAWRNIKGGRK